MRGLRRKNAFVGHPSFLFSRFRRTESKPASQVNNKGGPPVHLKIRSKETVRKSYSSLYKRRQETAKDFTEVSRSAAGQIINQQESRDRRSLTKKGVEGKEIRYPVSRGFGLARTNCAEPVILGGVNYAIRRRGAGGRNRWKEKCSGTVCETGVGPIRRRTIGKRVS